MNTKLAALAVAAVMVAGLSSSAFAHTAQTIGNYHVEVGWQNEPAIIGQENAITVAITQASEEDKANADTTKTDMNHTDENMTAMEDEHDDEGPLTNGITGLASTLDVTVTLNDKKTTLSMVEQDDNPGMYVGKFTPDAEGYPTVHVYTTIDNTPLEATFHPEQAENGAVFDQTSSDGSLNVHVTTTAPTKDKEMLVKLEFTDSDGNPVKHVNYGVTAMQDQTQVLSVDKAHTMTGEDQQSTMALSSEDPVDVKVNILGIGEPGYESAWGGPKEELQSIHVTPEFGPLAILLLSVAITASIVLVPRVTKL